MNAKNTKNVSEIWTSNAKNQPWEQETRQPKNLQKKMKTRANREKIRALNKGMGLLKRGRILCREDWYVSTSIVVYFAIAIEVCAHTRTDLGMCTYLYGYEQT